MWTWGLSPEGFRGRAAKGAVATCKQTVRSAQLVVGEMPSKTGGVAAGADVCGCPGSYAAGFPCNPFSTSCTSPKACLHVATAPLAVNTASL